MFGLDLAPLVGLLGKLPWKWIGLALDALAVLGLLWAVYSFGYRKGVAHVEPLLVSAQRDMDVCHRSVATLTGSIASQNAAVDALKADTARRTAAGDKAAQQAHSAAQAASVKAGSIMAAKPGSDVCKAAFDLVRSSVR